MAELNINVNANTQSAEKNLKSLQTVAKNTGTATESIGAGIKDSANTAKSSNSVFKNLFSNIQTEANSATKAIDKMESGISKVKNIAAGILTAMGIDKVLGGITSTVSSAIDNAEDAFGRGGQLNHYYRENVEDLLKWSEDSAHIYGMSSREATKYIDGFTSSLKNLGFTSEDALAKASVNLTKLSGDLSKTYNLDPSDAYNALFSAITTGRGQELKQFGVILNEQAYNAYLASQGIDAIYGSLTKTEQAMVRYAYIMNETNYAQGEFNDNINTWGASILTLKNQWDDFLSLLGSYAIPILQPIVQWLATALAYTKAFIQELAKAFGWSQYVAEATELAVAPTKLIADETEETVEANKANTAAIKATNKELKKGVKLLDLYTIDFGTDLSTAGTTVETPNIADTEKAMSDLAKIVDDLAYKDIQSAWAPDVDVDISKVKDAVEWVKKLWQWCSDVFDKIWHFEVFGVSLEDIFNDFMEDPVGTLAKLFGQIFAVSSLIKVAKSLILPNIAKSGIGKMIGGALMSAIIGGLIGFSIGDAIFGDIADKDRIDDEVAKLLGTLGGALTGAITGGAIAGVPGAIVGAIVGGIGGMLGTELAKQMNLREAFETEFDELYASGVSYREKYDILFNEIFGDKEFTSLYRDLQQQQEDLATQTEKYTNETIPTLLAKLNENPGDENLLAQLDKAAGGLKDNLTEATKLQGQIDREVFDSVYGSLAENLGDANKNAGELYKSLIDIKTQAELQEQSDYADYIVKLGQGIKLEGEDLERFNYLQEKYGTITDKADAISKSFQKSFDSAIASGKTYAEAMEELKDDYDAVQQAYTDAQIGAEYALKDGIITEAQEAAIIEQATKSQHDLWNKVNKLSSDIASEQTEKTAGALAKTIGDNLFEANKGVFDSYLSEAYKEFIDPVRWTEDGSEIDSRWAEYIKDAPFSFEETPDAFVDRIAKAFNIASDDPQYQEKISAGYSAMLSGVLSNVPMEIAWDTGNVTINPVGIQKADPTLTTNYIRSLFPNTAYQTTQVGADGRITITNKTIDIIEPEIKYAKLNVPASERDKYVTSLTDSGMQAIADSQAKVKSEVEQKDTGVDTGKELADNTADGYTAAIVTKDNTEKMTTAVNNAMQTASNTEEAKAKGINMGTAYMDSLANAISTNSKYPDALSGITAAFKNALDTITGYINNWSLNLSTAITGLDIPDNITFTELLNIIKSKNLNIPKLANGAVIPPNNPFIAMLGDQTSGYNIEAPLSTIKDAVRDVNAEQDITVNTTIYIGNTEIKDYIVDTVIDSNLVTG